MTESLLTKNDQKERLSVVYANALAAYAGYVAYEPSGPDRDSVDLGIRAGGQQRPGLDVQLKATSNLTTPQAGGDKSFRLSKKNYDDLRAQTQTPRLLVVLELPKHKTHWLTVTTEELTLRHRAYWLSLQQNHDEVVD